MKLLLTQPIKKHPPYYTMNGKLYEWYFGGEVAWTKTRTLVRAQCGADFWTWIDDMGERVWDIVA